jgi:hypothetical protein
VLVRPGWWNGQQLDQKNHRTCASTEPSLYFSTNSDEWADRFEEAAVEMGVMMGAESLPRTPKSEMAILVTLDGELLDLKERAMRAQATQVDDLRNAMGPELYREILREEAFRRP